MLCSPRRNLPRSYQLLIICLSLGLLAGGCGRLPGRAAADRSATPLAGAPQAHFTDITQAAGLDFRQLNCGCGLRYFVEEVTAGASLLDANGDGYPDIYFAQPKPLGACVTKFPAPLHQRLYLNDRQGHFKLSPHAFDTESAYGIGSAVGDYDNDGHEDLYVACYGRNTLYHNRGDGTFEDVTRKAGVAAGGMSTGAVWFDYDGDGYLDLYVMRYSRWSVATDIACYTDDGRRDVCLPTTYPAEKNILYHNNGDGTFTDVTARSGLEHEPRRSLGAVAADFDGDGKLDLFVANDMSPNYLYLNRGGGKFEDVAMQRNVAFGYLGRAQANMGVAVGDYDEDGDLDVLVTTFDGEPYTLYRNDGAYFTDVSVETGIAQSTIPSLGFGTGFFDACNSGALDLFFANGHVYQFSHQRSHRHEYKQHNQLLMSQSGGAKFVPDDKALPASDVRVHRGACFGDINNDGRVDILVTANDDRPTLLRNDSQAGNWLQLKLVDKHGCATPVGTKCIATFGGHKRMRVVLGGGSYAGSSDYRVHFGLGAAPQVDRLVIHWMSGLVQVLNNVGANRILTVREGQAPP